MNSHTVGPNITMLKTKVNKENCLNNKARYLSNEISKKVVVKPNNDRIVGDAIKGLKLYVNRLRWQEYFKIKHVEETSKGSSINNSLDDLSIDSNLSREYNYNKKEWERILETDKLLLEESEGLGTKFKLSKIKTAPPGSIDLESFINDL